MKISNLSTILILFIGVSLKLLLQQPMSLESAQGRGAGDETDFKGLISDDQIKELEMFQEELKYNDLQNEKDDDEIYSFGLRAQQDPSLLNKNKMYISGFKKLMTLGSRINEIYNRFKGLTTPDPMSVQDNLKDGLNNFEITKTLTLMISYDFSDINKELEDVYHNLNFVDMTPLECIEFLGFKDYFARILKNHDQTTSEFVELQHKLELRIYDFVRKGKLFLDSIYAIRHFDRLIFSFFEDFGKEFKQDDSHMDTDEKITSSVSIIQQSLKFKNVFADIFTGVTTGLENLNTIRDDVLNLLNRMNDLDEESLKQEDKESLKNDDKRLK